MRQNVPFDNFYETYTNLMRRNWHAFYTAYISTAKEFVNMAKIICCIKIETSFHHNCKSDNHDIVLLHKYVFMIICHLSIWGDFYYVDIKIQCKI